MPLLLFRLTFKALRKLVYTAPSRSSLHPSGGIHADQSPFELRLELNLIAQPSNLGLDSIANDAKNTKRTTDTKKKTNFICIFAAYLPICNKTKHPVTVYI